MKPWMIYAAAGAMGMLLARGETNYVFKNLETTPLVASNVFHITNTPLTMAPVGVGLSDTITTKSGTVYRFVRVQQAYPNALVISCIKPNGVRDLESINFEDLSEDLQRKYKYDPAKAKQYHEREQERHETFKSVPTTNPWQDYSNAVERTDIQFKRDVADAKLALELYRYQIREREVVAQEKQANAAMLQALTPSQINILQRVTVY